MDRPVGSCQQSEYPEKQELLRHLSQELDEIKLMHSVSDDLRTRISRTRT